MNALVAEFAVKCYEHGLDINTFYNCKALGVFKNGRVIASGSYTPEGIDKAMNELKELGELS